MFSGYSYRNNIFKLKLLNTNQTVQHIPETNNVPKDSHDLQTNKNNTHVITKKNVIKS